MSLYPTKTVEVASYNEDETVEMIWEAGLTAYPYTPMDYDPGGVQIDDAPYLIRINFMTGEGVSQFFIGKDEINDKLRERLEKYAPDDKLILDIAAD
jgi:hypothetical protein